MSKKIELQINSQPSLDLAILTLRAEWEKHKFVTITLQKERKRTNQQNRSLHLYCQMVADELNRAGLDMRRTLKPDIDMPWTMQAVKDYIWRPVQEAILNKESTTEANSAEYTEVYEVLTRHFGEKFGIYIPWPARDYEQD